MQGPIVLTYLGVFVDLSAASRPPISVSAPDGVGHGGGRMSLSFLCSGERLPSPLDAWRESARRSIASQLSPPAAALHARHSLRHPPLSPLDAWCRSAHRLAPRLLDYWCRPPSPSAGSVVVRRVRARGGGVPLEGYGIE
jgi:hypothetical protein